MNKVGTNANTPVNVVLSPLDNKKILDFVDLDDTGINTLKDSQAFKKIQKFSKLNLNDLIIDNTDLYNKYNKISNLYLNDTSLINSNTYSTSRQGLYLNHTSTNFKNKNLFEPKLYKGVSSYNHNSTTLKDENSLYPRTSVLESYSSFNSLKSNVTYTLKSNALLKNLSLLEKNTKLNPLQYLMSTIDLKIKEDSNNPYTPNTKDKKPNLLNILDNTTLQYTQPSIYLWDLNIINSYRSTNSTFTDIKSTNKSTTDGILGFKSRDNTNIKNLNFTLKNYSSLVGQILNLNTYLLKDLDHSYINNHGMSNLLNSSGDKFKNTFTSSNLGKPPVVNLNSTSMFNLENLTY